MIPITTAPLLYPTLLLYQSQSGLLELIVYLLIMAAVISLLIKLNQIKNAKYQASAKAPSQPKTSQPQSVPLAPKTSVTIFISYRRQDSGDVTGRIYDRLVQQFGREAIFKDVDSIPLGVDFRGVLDKAVGKCNLLLAVIGRQWIGSQNESGARRLDDPRDFVRIEI